jgi:hypothetical protein
VTDCVLHWLEHFKPLWDFLTAIGAWLGAIATFAAVVVSLWLATRSERVRLRGAAAILHVFAGDGSPPEEFVGITAVNLGDRPVTINSVGWRIGRWKWKRYCIQVFDGPATSDQYPIELAHGKEAKFMIPLRVVPNWPKEFVTDFVKDSNLRTLRAQIHTSVWQSVDVFLAESLLRRLRLAQRDAGVSQSALTEPTLP